MRGLIGVERRLIFERDIGTGQIKTWHLNWMEFRNVGPIPDIDYEIIHNRGIEPSIVIITETSTGTEGQVFLVSRTMTSIVVRSETGRSGVIADISLIW